MAKISLPEHTSVRVAAGLAVMSAIAGAVVGAAAAIGTVAGKLYWRHVERTSGLSNK